VRNFAANSTRLRRNKIQKQRGTVALARDGTAFAPLHRRIASEMMKKMALR
jgi:hypothetical protein